MSQYTPVTLGTRKTPKLAASKILAAVQYSIEPKATETEKKRRNRVGLPAWYATQGPWRGTQ